jgi:ribosomal protein S18 acetylase RimI-like enzyme
LSGPTTRIATLDDLPALHRLIERAYRGETAKVGWTNEADLLDGQRTDVEELTEILTDPARIMLLAEDADGLAGFVSLFLAADPQWGTHVDNLHVRPGLKGQGLGRRLLGAAARLALAEAPGQGLDLFVYTANTAARGFYARLGGADVTEWLETAPDGSRQPVRRIWWPDPAALLEPA